MSAEKYTMPEIENMREALQELDEAFAELKGAETQCSSALSAETQ